MNKNGNITKLIITASFVIWSMIVLSAFYITQRPLVFQIIGGTIATLWSITLTIILLINSAGLGYFILRRIQPQLTSPEQLILGSGFGLGILGLTGYGLAAAGLATAPMLAFVLFGLMLCVFIFKIHSIIWHDLHELANSFQNNQNNIPAWLPIAIVWTVLLGFFFSLLPPVEGFDGLFYHLRLPEQLLADGKILPYNILQFWFPSLLEGDFLWGLGLGSERTAQLIHWSFSVFALGLIWEWSRQVFGHKAAWWTLALLISMPSLTWLSAWAYTDMALIFFFLAGLYTCWRWIDTDEKPWLFISGLFTGMAMGIKYTSFILPVFCVAMIWFYGKNFWGRVQSSIKYSLPAVFVALPWYLRNWLVMGNPFYPFVFGGRYWDAFQSDWYNGAGTGLGWNIGEILILPFTLTLGHRDQNYFDGRMGPLFLLLLPLALWMLWIKRNSTAREHKVLFIITTFALLNYFFWMFSVIQTVHLWQSRLLFPGLIPFSMVIGFGVANLDEINLPQLRISFIVTMLIGLVISITLIDNTLSLIPRRPLAYALGIESRESYFERIQPQYFDALKLVATTPINAHIYFMREPRTYNMPRKVQPDPINNNLLHDFYLYGDVAGILKNWKTRGYTHLLVLNTVTDVQFSEAFDQIMPYLKLTEQNQNYKLYLITQ